MEREDLDRKKLQGKAGILSEENNELEQNNEDSTFEHTRKEMYIMEYKDQTWHMEVIQRSASQLWSPKGRTGVCSYHKES